MIHKSVKQASEKPNIIVISIAPGWLKTGGYPAIQSGLILVLLTNLFHDIDMGGPDASYDVDFSVGHQIKLVVAATPADTGKFKAYDGTEYPW